MDSVHKSLTLPSDSLLETDMRAASITSNCSWVSEITHLWRGFSLRKFGWSTLSRGWCLAGAREVPPAKSSFQQTVTDGLCLTSEKHRRSPYEGPIVWSQWLFLASGLLLYQRIIQSGCWGGHVVRVLPWYSRILVWVRHYRRSSSDSNGIWSLRNRFLKVTDISYCWCLKYWWHWIFLITLRVAIQTL